jgi:hypothetical protein
MAIQDLCSDFVAAVLHLATMIQMNATLTPDDRNNYFGCNIWTWGGWMRRQKPRMRQHRRPNRSWRSQGGFLGTYSSAKWHTLSAEDRKKRLKNHSPLSPKRANQRADALSTGSAMTRRSLMTMVTSLTTLTRCMLIEHTGDTVNPLGFLTLFMELLRTF